MSIVILVANGIGMSLDKNTFSLSSALNCSYRNLNTNEQAFIKNMAGKEPDSEDDLRHLQDVQWLFH